MSVTVDQAVKLLKDGESLTIWREFERYAKLVFISDHFFIETYEVDTRDWTSKLINVECVSEETALFSLTAKYEV